MNKIFVSYYPFTYDQPIAWLDEEGNTKVYASIYNPNDEKSILYPIESEKEWKIVETILSELQNEVGKGTEN